MLLHLLAAAAAIATPATQTPYLHAPAVAEYARHDPSGTTILPSGRFLKPAGHHLAVARWPHGLTLSPDGKTAFVASEGVGQLITDWNTATPHITELAPTEGKTDKRSNAGAVAFSPNGSTLYWSSGETGCVYVFNVETKQKTAEIPLNTNVSGKTYTDSFVMDLKVSPDGNHLYCADVTNFRVAVIDTKEDRVVGSVGVGRYPYALALVGNSIYVTNIGMYEYSAISKPDNDKDDKRGLTFPPYGTPSKEAEDGVENEGRKIPGLGDPNAPESFSVWRIDIHNPTLPRVTGKLKTGLLVGAPSETGKTVGGSAPNFLVSNGKSLYVSNGNNDQIERIELPAFRIAAKLRLQPSPLTARLRGVGPAGMTLSRDGKRLFVAESGINAIAVVDSRSLKAVGHIPTAWYPYRLELTRDGKSLLCICFKGFGNGPSAGAVRPTDPFMNIRGVFSAIPLPNDTELKALTNRVLVCNGMVNRAMDRKKMETKVIPSLPGVSSKEIKYVVFITKENHAYDTIFDHIPGANDDPTLLRWGLKQRIAADKQPTLESVPVMTNHNALARQFTVSDNFYLEPEFSGVGHRWLVGVQPNNFCQMTYTLGWGFKVDSTAPGRRASFGSNSSLAPEDYPEAGSVWEHLAQYGKTFRNYGEGFEFAGVMEDDDERPTGARETVNIPMPKPLYDNTCREYPVFNMNIPDQFRVDQFIKDFNKRYVGTKTPMPSFVNIAICNDHGTSPNAAKGYPYLASWMADNDLALGRLVDFLSHTSYWKNMAIFVTEDDSGGEPDHVDAQRSVMLVISPYARRGQVSKRHTNVTSMHRTLYQILGIPPLNMFDALSNDLSESFTDKPDYRPYNHAPVDIRVFDPNKARDPSDPDYSKALRAPSIRLDDPAEIERVLRGE